MANPNPVVHFDIASPDPKRAREFYGSLFGWQIKVDPAWNYAMIESGENGIPGGIGEVDLEKAPAGIVMYSEVEDAAATLSKVEGLGGKVLIQPYELEGMGHFAVLEDPDGNPFGIFQLQKS